MKYFFKLLISFKEPLVLLILLSIHISVAQQLRTYGYCNDTMSDTVVVSLQIALHLLSGRIHSIECNPYDPQSFQLSCTDIHIDSFSYHSIDPLHLDI